MLDERSPPDAALSETDWRALVTQSLDEGDKRMDRFESAIHANTALTQEIKADTAEFLEIFRAMRGGFKVLGWFGNIAKWAASIGAAVLGLYYVWKAGHR